MRENEDYITTEQNISLIIILTACDCAAGCIFIFGTEYSDGFFFIYNV